MCRYGQPVNGNFHLTSRQLSEKNVVQWPSIQVLHLVSFCCVALSEFQSLLEPLCRKWDDENILQDKEGTR